MANKEKSQEFTTEKSEKEEEKNLKRNKLNLTFSIIKPLSLFTLNLFTFKQSNEQPFSRTRCRHITQAFICDICIC